MRLPRPDFDFNPHYATQVARIAKPYKADSFVLGFVHVADSKGLMLTDRHESGHG